MRPAAISLLFLTVAMTLVVTPSGAQDLSGEWITWKQHPAGSAPFLVTFDHNGSYRAECRDEAFCSLCTGGGPLVETGNYRVSEGVITVTITESNAANRFLRIGKPFEVGYTFTQPDALTMTNARALTIDWSPGDTITLVQTVTSVERKTWRAIKALFR